MMREVRRRLGWACATLLVLAAEPAWAGVSRIWAVNDGE